MRGVRTPRKGAVSKDATGKDAWVRLMKKDAMTKQRPTTPTSQRTRPLRRARLLHDARS
jgi:hypothetical protein